MPEMNSKSVVGYSHLKRPLLLLSSLILFLGNSTPSDARFMRLPELSELTSREWMKETVKLAGMFGANRPNQSATPLGNDLGYQFFLETTMIKTPEKMMTQSFSERTLSAPRIHFQLGLTPAYDLGLFYYGEPLEKTNHRNYGASLKWNVHTPKEGPNWAFRLAYSHFRFSYVSLNSWSPQLLISRNLDFADIYLGSEYTWISGRIRGSLNSSSVDIQGLETFGASSFLGLILKIPTVRLRLGLEGSYSFHKAHSLGATAGFYL